MSRVLLITGATGGQGGAVVDSLVDLHKQKKLPADTTVLALTRNAQSEGAARTAAKAPDLIKLVQGSLDDVPALFRTARATAGDRPIWGVYAVLASSTSGGTDESEVRQGKALIDESIAQGVHHFVYSSVERGGDEKSWNNPTDVPHFITKHEIEHYLRDSTGKQQKTNGKGMSWTILRPVALVDAMQPGFKVKVFMTAMRDNLDGKPVQWLATRDMGYFGAVALTQPDEWRGRALGLAGDELTFEQLSSVFERVTGAPAPTTFSLAGSALMYAATELRIMIKWFAREGYGVDITALRKIRPEMTDVETFLRRDSGFAKASAE